MPESGNNNNNSNSNSNSNSNNNNDNNNNNNNSNGSKKGKKRSKGEIDDCDIDINLDGFDNDEKDGLGGDIANFDWKNDVLVWNAGNLETSASLSRLTDLFLSGRLGPIGSGRAKNALESLKGIIMSMAYGDDDVPPKKKRKKDHRRNRDSNKSVMFYNLFIFCEFVVFCLRLLY